MKTTMKISVLLAVILLTVLTAGCGAEGVSLQEGMPLYESVEAARQGGESQDMVGPEDTGTPIREEVGDGFVVYRVRLINRREDGRPPIRYIRRIKEAQISPVDGESEGEDRVRIGAKVGKTLEGAPYGLIFWLGLGVVLFVFLRRLVIRFYVSRSFTISVSRLRTSDGFEVPNAKLEIFFTRDLRPDAMDRFRELGQKGVESQIGSTTRGWLLDKAIEVGLRELAQHLQESLRNPPRFPEVGINIYRILLLEVNYEENQERILEADASAKARGQATKTFIEESGLPPVAGAIAHALGLGPLFSVHVGPGDGGEA